MGESISGGHTRLPGPLTYLTNTLTTAVRDMLNDSELICRVCYHRSLSGSITDWTRPTAPINHIRTYTLYVHALCVFDGRLEKGWPMCTYDSVVSPLHQCVNSISNPELLISTYWEPLILLPNKILCINNKKYRSKKGFPKMVILK